VRRPQRVKVAAPARLITAVRAHGMAGIGVPCPGTPVVTAATSSKAAMPKAVPSCAAVLMIPEAVPRAAAATVVPSPAAATEDRPMPAPTDGDTHRQRPRAGGGQDEPGVGDGDRRQADGDDVVRSEAGEGWRGQGGADNDGEAEWQQHLRGSERAEVTGVCRKSMASVIAELVVSVFNSPPIAP
jgi:hypothetical protein